jgi:hypothetical protein
MREKVFKKPSFLASCQAGEKEANADEVDEGLHAACLKLVVLAHPALPADLRVGPLHHPALR